MPEEYPIAEVTGRSSDHYVLRKAYHGNLMSVTLL